MSALTDALTKRQTSEERLRSFAADAGHELRTPMASIRGHAELALVHPGPAPRTAPRALERIEAEATRTGEMGDDLLLLARLDAGRPLERLPVDLTLLALDTVTDAQAAGGRKPKAVATAAVSDIGVPPSALRTATRRARTAMETPAVPMPEPGGRAAAADGGAETEHKSIFVFCHP